jgi:hypothetical protein
MNTDILENIKNKYTISQFGLDCLNCEMYGNLDSQEFGMCGNCCICILNNFAFRSDIVQLKQFIKSDEFYEIQKRLYYYLHKNTVLMNRLFNHIDKCNN